MGHALNLCSAHHHQAMSILYCLTSLLFMPSKPSAFVCSLRMTANCIFYYCKWGIWCPCIKSLLIYGSKFHHPLTPEHPCFLCGKSFDFWQPSHSWLQYLGDPNPQLFWGSIFICTCYSALMSNMHGNTRMRGLHVVLEHDLSAVRNIPFESFSTFFEKKNPLPYLQLITSRIILIVILNHYRLNLSAKHAILLWKG